MKKGIQAIKSSLFLSGRGEGDPILIIPHGAKGVLREVTEDADPGTDRHTVPVSFGRTVENHFG